MSLFLLKSDAALALPQESEDLADQVQLSLESFTEDNPAFGPGWVRLARLHAIRGNVDQLPDSVDRVVDATDKAEPNDLIRLWYDLRHEAPAEAGRVLAYANEHYPDRHTIVYARAVDLAERGEVDQAAAIVESALADADDNLPMRVIAARYHEGRDPERVREIARTVIIDDFSHRADAQLAMLELSSVWDEQELVDQAILNLQTVGGDAGTAWRLAKARALLAFAPEDLAQERAAEATTVLRPVIQADPGNTRARLLLARADLVLDDEGSAITNLGIAADAKGGDPQLLIDLVKMLQSTGQQEDARRRLRTLLAATDLSLDMQRERARLLVRQGMFDEAIGSSRRWPRSGPSTTGSSWRSSMRSAIEPMRRNGSSKSWPDTQPGIGRSAAGRRGLSLRADNLQRGLEYLDRAETGHSSEQAAAASCDLSRAPMVIWMQPAPCSKRRLRDTGTTMAWRSLAQFLLRRNDKRSGPAGCQQGLGAHPGRFTAAGS